MKKKIIVNIVFNTFGFTEDRFTEKWINNRMDLFMNYTVQSLKSQTNQDFLTLVRYDDSTKQLIENAISKYEKLPNNIIFTGKKEFYQILSQSIKGFDYLYLVRIDSDDMYHKTYINQLHKYQHKPETEVIINQNGYLYDITNQQVAPIHYESPSFYTLIYKTEDYLNGKRYTLPGGHAGAITLKHEIISRRNFLNLITGKNTLPKNILNKGTILSEKEAKLILKEFRN
ncbi:putative rhamnosyltransferase [Neobacillus bataviensis]|uniref:Putative rhamnosyltransferase n=1 Tax=Neobacillus bataviensis TaxID=220685 RepID=A0A561DC12_9BACI|nr:glycosyltransferase family A protein [Neobacillus bataviensis]TWE00954.1 putative rhamnosyltransferase [Neobacillus bataviensis]